MPQVIVLNPPHSGSKKKHRRAMKKKRKLSSKQLAALARGRAKMAAKRRKVSAPAKAKVRRSRRSRRRGKSILSRQGRHRPVVLVRKGRLHRPRRSSIPRRSTFANPFLSEIAMIGNPHRRKRRHAKRHARRHTRRSRSLIFRNPMGGALSAVTSGPREMIQADFLKEAAGVAVGFVAPNLLMPMLPANLRDARWKVYASKVAVISGLAAVANVAVGKRASKAILLGGGVSVLLDLYADFVAPHLAPAAPAGTAAYYGEPTGGVGAYYGEPTNVGLSDSMDQV